MKWAILVILILLFTFGETYLSIKTYQKHVKNGTYEENKKKIIGIRLLLYFVFYLITFTVYTFSKG